MLEVDGICVKVHLAPIRNIYLTVQPPDAHINVRAPHGVRNDHIVALVQKKRQWINRKRAIIQQNPFCKPKQYVEGEAHLMLGQPYLLHFEHSASTCCSVHCIDEKMVVRGGDLLPQKSAQLLSSYLRSELHSVLDELFAIWINIMQLSPCSFVIRSLKRLWGSCNILKRHITINAVLVHYPLSCIEYVVVHELVHLFEPSHNQRFYRLLEHYLPDWHRQHSFLRRYPIATYC